MSKNNVDYQMERKQAGEG